MFVRATSCKPKKEASMRWVAPEFELLTLMSEATCYRYSR